MSDKAAREALEHRLDGMERKANVLLEIVNDLRKEEGLEPRPPFGGSDGPRSYNGSGHQPAGGTVTGIKGDTFFGKKLQTALREYLEMRKAQTGDGPATPREMYDAITSGGFRFDAKDDTIALVGLRALLRKRTAFFIKLNNGRYGLTSWYPDAKKPRVVDDSKNRAAVDAGAQTSDVSDDDDDDEPAATTAQGAAA